MAIRILVGAVLAFSLMLNVWHYRNFFRRVIHGRICSKPVSILDQSGAWYTKRPVLINHAGVWGGGIGI